MSAAVLCLLAWGGGGRAAKAQEVEFTADRVKAAFLYNFGSFVEWPSGALQAGSLEIAVLGAPVVAEELRHIAAGRTIQGQPVRVREIANLEEVGGARIVFLGKPVGDRLKHSADSLHARHVLIVTQEPDAIGRGSMINFALVDRRVRFEVSLAATQAAGLQVSSRLLGIALRVERSGGVFEEPESQHVALSR